MTLSPDQLAALATQLVAAATEKNLTLRVLGGIAIYLTCPSIGTHAKLQRPIKDIDFAATRQDFDPLAELFSERGATLQSKEPQQWTWTMEGVEIEVAVPDFREDHRIDLAERLALASPTLPLVDLLLVKLARVKFVEKDVQDSLALLLDHSVAKEKDQAQIDPEYVAKLCGRDWGLFTTVYDNTVLLEQVADKYLEPTEAQSVWRRIELIQEQMDEEPKSLMWMVNQIIRRPTQVPA